MLNMDSAIQLTDESIKVKKVEIREIDNLKDLSESDDDAFIQINGECTQRDVQVVSPPDQESYKMTEYQFNVKNDFIIVRHWGDKPLMYTGKKYQLYYVQYHHGKDKLLIKPYSRITPLIDDESD